jgi:hypothetical protein
MRRLLEIMIGTLTLASLAGASSQSLIESTSAGSALPNQLMSGPAPLAIIGGLFIALATLVRRRHLSGHQPTGGAI